jgi:hypothetical protein
MSDGFKPQVGPHFTHQPRTRSYRRETDEKRRKKKKNTLFYAKELSRNAQRRERFILRFDFGYKGSILHNTNFRFFSFHEVNVFENNHHVFLVKRKLLS